MYDLSLFDRCRYDESPAQPAELPARIRMVVREVFALDLACRRRHDVPIRFAGVVAIDSDQASDVVAIGLASPTQLLADVYAATCARIGLEAVPHP